MRFYFIYISYMNFLKSDDIYFSIPELSKDFNEESTDSFDLALYYKLFKEHNKIVTNSYQETMELGKKLASKLEDLVVSECFINPGVIYRRWKPASRSRVDRRDKRTSHITVKVSDGKEA